MADNEQVNYKYKGIPEKIARLLEEYEIEYFREDKPIPFCGLTIYPVDVRNYEMFAFCSPCFTLNKNDDKVGVKMSHLEYLLYKTQIKENNEGVLWANRLHNLLKLIFHIENGLKCSKCGKILSYESPEFISFIQSLQQLKQDQNDGKPLPETFPALKCPDCQNEDFSEMIKIVNDPQTKTCNLIVDGHVITKQDFNSLRQIVLFQNLPDYRDESWIDPEIKKDHDEKMRLEQQKNDVHASIEKKVVCLSITTNYSFEEIYNMSIRKFSMALETVDDLINYKITRSAIMSGFVQLPKGKTIEHWIYKPNKDMYGDSYKSTDQVMSEASNL